jgi:hypothetical protein
MNTRNILWIDELAVANIEDSQQRLLFFLRDHDGTHLTIWMQDGVSRFECSSVQPVGSVWDEARRGVARDHPDLKYRNWQKHANYFVNRPLDYFPDSSLPLVTFSMPRRLKTARPSLRSKPALHLSAPGPHFDLSLYFSPSRSTAIPDSVIFEAEIGRLIIGLTMRSSERRHRSAAALYGKRTDNSACSHEKS